MRAGTLWSARGRKPGVQPHHGHLDSHIEAGPAAVRRPARGLEERDPCLVARERPGVPGAEPVLGERVGHGVQQPLVVPARRGGDHVQLVKLAVGGRPQVVVAGGPGRREPEQVRRARLGDRHVHPVLRRRRRADRVPPPRGPLRGRLRAGQLLDHGVRHQPGERRAPARDLHLSQPGRVRRAGRPDEPAGHAPGAPSPEMSRAAPVDAEVASAAYTWSAALTARCLAAGRYEPSAASSACLRSASTSSGTSSRSSLRGMSMTIVSSSCTSAMTPPLAASGEICPIDNPEVPPENRPSVISAHARPRPFPLRNDVGYSISCMPGPPRGPSYLMTTTSPALTRPASIPSTASSCDSKTRAGPENVHSSSGTPAVFTTPPSGARFPYSMHRPPSAVYACVTSLMHPAAASRSSESQRADCEYPLVVRTPPGAAWYSSTASGSTDEDRRSQSEIGEPCTVCTDWLSSPARSSSPRMV